MEVAWWAPWQLSQGAVLFVFFNVVVGTIALMSRSAQQRHGHRALNRSASSAVLDRLRSFPLFNFRSTEYFPPHPPTTDVVDASASVTAADDITPEPRESVVDREAETAAAHKTNKETLVSEPSISLDEAYELVQRRRRPAAAAAAAAAKKEARTAAAAPAEKQESVGKAELNARADDFIKQFRTQLRLQRLNSLLNYKKT